MQSMVTLRFSELPSLGAALYRRLSIRSSSNFRFAFLFLGTEQREALKDIYQFCRVVDDIVDERPPGVQGAAEAEKALQNWRTDIERIYHVQVACSSNEIELHDPLAKRLQSSNCRFQYPRAGFDGIIDGCAMDLEQDRYSDLAELELYCYRVASCVGLLCIAIFGDQSAAAQDYARHLGLALQYTNILRDVAEDAQRGRVYLPEQLLNRHGLTASDVLQARYDHRYISAANEFADIAENEYRQAWESFREIQHPAVLVPAEVMGQTYYKILCEVRRLKFDSFTQRAQLRRRDKLGVAATAIAKGRIPHRLQCNLLERWT